MPDRHPRRARPTGEATVRDLAAAAVEGSQPEDDAIDLLRFGAGLITLVMAVVLFHAG